MKHLTPYWFSPTLVSENNNRRCWRCAASRETKHWFCDYWNADLADQLRYFNLICDYCRIRSKHPALNLKGWRRFSIQKWLCGSLDDSAKWKIADSRVEFELVSPKIKYCPQFFVWKICFLTRFITKGKIWLSIDTSQKIMSFSGDKNLNSPFNILLLLLCS